MGAHIRKVKDCISATKQFDSPIFSNCMGEMFREMDRIYLDL